MILRIVPVGALETNCYVVGCETSREAMVIDPGAEPERILAVLDSLGLTCKMIVNTHGHVDHMMANQALREATGAVIAIGREDAHALEDPEANLSLWASPWTKGVTSPAADLLLVEGDELSVGTVRLRVLHTPGHTPGSISLAGEGLVFSGDVLFAGGGIGRTDFPGGSHETLLRSIDDKLLSLPEETRVYPGHGPSTSIGEERMSGVGR